MSPDNEAELDSEDEGGEDEASGGKVKKASLSANLTGKQRRYLRAQGHRLTAVLQIGKEGITDPLVKNALLQLQAHELIKVKVSDGAPSNRHRSAEELAKATESELAQVLGRTFLLYKARKEKPELRLPK